jgi:hypothetical protein
MEAIARHEVGEKKNTLCGDDFFVTFDGIFIAVLTQDVRVK